MMFTAPHKEAGPMQTLTIEVTQDHIDRLSKAKKPVLGIAELIWNGVDADATVVDVRLNRNGLGSLDSIEVIDNGLGITMVDAQEGIRSRYLSPLATELSVMARPSAVAIAICAEVSVGSGAVSGLSRISSIDGNCRKSRRNAINSAAAAGPTVPSSSCASNSLAPERKEVFCRFAMPRRTLEAISQDRGVGQALATDQ
jgi:hypothetical protein